jgi:NAD+ diphosphatase
MTEDGGAARLLSAGELPGGSATSLDAVLLGVVGGRTCFAVQLSGSVEPEPPRGCVWRDLRRHAGLLPPAEGALLAYARAMLYWHRRHRFCGTCGAPTRGEEAGHLRVCSDGRCDARHFPRTDPAIIVLVSDPAGERCLLGRQREWVPGMYSCLAGFVEPGESLEHAVLREVQEETGVSLSSVGYRSSQPWPFPSSLMLGFTAVAATESIVRGDDELEDARWFSRGQLVAGFENGSLRTPNPVSIAYRLIEEWFDAGGRALGEVIAEVRPR